MRTRRQVFAGLAWLAAPATALAEAKPAASQTPTKPTPAKPPSRKPDKPTAGKPVAKADHKAERPATKPPAARARPEPAPPAAAAEPPRPRPARRRDDSPALRPVDRELVRGWLAANPDWVPPAAPQRLAEGRPVPPGMPRPALPPGLAVLLPYFPGYRYLAAGPDLALVESATDLVASLLPGALAR